MQNSSRTELFIAAAAGFLMVAALPILFLIAIFR